PNEYLVITGAGIEDLKICKKAFVWPFQKCVRFDITPINYTLKLQAMSAEKLEFILPAVFTIGPKDDHDSLVKFARLLADSSSHESVQDLVRGVIEGETRVIAAGMTIEEIFKERKYFKEQAIKNVQVELDQFGLSIYNVNVKQLTDSAGSEYFQYLRLKTHEGAVNQAKVDVAEARFKGDVGEKQRIGLTRKENARIESETVIYENTKKIEISQAETTLKTKQTEYDQQVQIAKIEAQKAAAMREAELQRDVESRRALVEQERLRAEKLATAKVGAEAIITTSDAHLYQKQREADAMLYEEQKKAEGVKMLYEAQAQGIQRLTEAFGGNPNATLQYLMLEKGLYQQLAQHNAEAIRGLQPKITVWNTGSGDHDSMKPVRDIFTSLPPLLSTINDQTGIAPPSWLANLGGKQTNAGSTSGSVSVPNLD
ncbi:hypothetical protein HK102_007205, partial [Quaeritorhiza haematococci]